MLWAFFDEVAVEYPCPYHPVLAVAVNPAELRWFQDPNHYDRSWNRVFGDLLWSAHVYPTEYVPLGYVVLVPNGLEAVLPPLVVRGGKLDFEPLVAGFTPQPLDRLLHRLLPGGMPPGIPCKMPPPLAGALDECGWLTEDERQTVRFGVLPPQ